jgi:hypothetical protein
MIIYYHVAVVLVWLNTVVKHAGREDTSKRRDHCLHYHIFIDHRQTNGMNCVEMETRFRNAFPFPEMNCCRNGKRIYVSISITSFGDRC